MLLTTGDSFEGKTIKEYRGIARGLVVRSPTIAQGLMGGLKSIVGGKINAYTQMCDNARSEACQLMIEHAQQVNANAIIAIRYDTGELGQAGSEVLCYGTAVVI